MARHLLPDTAVGRVASRFTMGPLQDHPGLLQHLCAGAQHQGVLTKHDSVPCVLYWVWVLYWVLHALSCQIAHMTTAADAAVLQGMMLLAGSTTVYQVLPAAGEKKKQKLQVP